MIRNEPIEVLPDVPTKHKIQDFGKATFNGFWTLLMPVIVLGGIYGGVFMTTCSVPVVLRTTYCPMASLWLPHLLMPKLVPAEYVTWTVF